MWIDVFFVSLLLFLGCLVFIFLFLFSLLFGSPFLFCCTCSGCVGGVFVFLGKELGDCLVILMLLFTELCFFVVYVWSRLISDRIVCLWPVLNFVQYMVVWGFNSVWIRTLIVWKERSFLLHMVVCLNFGTIFVC